MTTKKLIERFGNVPGLGIISFMEVLFRAPKNTADESRQVDEVLDHVLGSFFLIGGMTSSVTTASNAHSLLTELGVNANLVDFLSFMTALLLFLVVDMSLKVLSPYSFDYAFNRRANKRDRVIGLVLISLVLSFGLLSIVMSYIGQDNTLSLGLGDKHKSSTSTSVLKEKDNKANNALLISLDKDIDKAEKEDSRKLKALKGEWHQKVKRSKSRHRKLIKKGNAWAKDQVRQVEIDSAEAVKLFKPTALSLIQQKNDILSKKAKADEAAYNNTGEDNKVLNQAHANKKDNLWWLLCLIGCGSTLFGIMISLVKGLQKDPVSKSQTRRTTSSTVNRGASRRGSVTTKKPSNQQVTGSLHKVTELDLEVTDKVTESITTPDLIKRIQANGNHWKNRRSLTYWNNMERDLRLLKDRLSEEDFNQMITDVHLTYNAQGFDIND